MSSGWTGYVVESAQARERRLLAEARTRRNELLEALTDVAAKQRALGIKASGFTATDGDSTHVAKQCDQLDELIQRAEQEIHAALKEINRRCAQEQLAEAMEAIKVDDALAQALARTREAARSGSPAPSSQATAEDFLSQAAAIVARQDVADPELAQQAADAVQQSPERARMLLAALRDEVDRRNARHRDMLRQAERERRQAIDAAAQAAAVTEEIRYVADAVRDSLQALGYQAADTQAVGAEHAVVMRSAAFPEHAVLTHTAEGRISLKTIRTSKATAPEVDRQADQALCQALAAFRDELQNRGITCTRVSHLPAGFTPVTTHELRPRQSKTSQAKTLRRQQ